MVTLIMMDGQAPRLPARQPKRLPYNIGQHEIARASAASTLTMHAYNAGTGSPNRTVRNARRARADREDNRTYPTDSPRARTGISGHPHQVGKPATNQRLQATRRRQGGRGIVRS